MIRSTGTIDVGLESDVAMDVLDAAADAAFDYDSLLELVDMKTIDAAGSAISTARAHRFILTPG